MAKDVRFLEFTDKVKNLSIPLDDAIELMSSLSDSAFDALIGAYFRFQLTGDENCYKGKQQALWKIMVSKKRKYFFNKYLKKQSDEIDEITKTQAELLAKSKENNGNNTLQEYYRQIGVHKN